MIGDLDPARAMHAAGGRPGAGRGLDVEIQATLGRRLRDLYRPEPAEPMPESILGLLDRLAAVMPPAALDADRADPDPVSSSR